VVTVRNNRFKNEQLYLLSVKVCVIYGFQNKQMFLPYSALTD